MKADMSWVFCGNFFFSKLDSTIQEWQETCREWDDMQQKASNWILNSDIVF